jgi:isopentenyl diphosphate isomerase/L-lactate dehydrogenase-like FMN-dependent dehydrogenase
VLGALAAAAAAASAAALAAVAEILGGIMTTGSFRRRRSGATSTSDAVCAGRWSRRYVRVCPRVVREVDDCGVV